MRQSDGLQKGELLAAKGKNTMMDKPMLNSERKRIIDFLKEKGCFIAAVILLAATVTLLCASELSS